MHGSGRPRKGGDQRREGAREGALTQGTRGDGRGTKGVDVHEPALLDQKGRDAVESRTLEVASRTREADHVSREPAGKVKTIKRGTPNDIPSAGKAPGTP